VIRPLRDEDIAAIAPIWRELRPDAMHSEAGLRHFVASFPPRAQAAFWIAEEDGIVAWCFAHRRWHRATDNGYVWLGVLPRARRRGLGAELWELAEEHLASIGVARINADVVDDARGERFLRRSGFEPTRRVVISAVDPQRVVAGREAFLRAGYRLVPYARADPVALHRLEQGLSADEPGQEEPRRMTFEEWQREFLGSPDLTLDGSFAVLAGDVPVAYSTLSVDVETRRGRNEGTATAREHRGRGLARLAKLAQLRWAADHGIERVVTDNDDTNAPMLAVNRRLGYEPFTERLGFVREGTASPRAPAAPAR
jgi:GNAT superfamily N-acetyltransferase